jgi:cyclopropane fatty-acyl-phospholipid synthase-like methyltransferase
MEEIRKAFEADEQELTDNHFSEAVVMELKQYSSAYFETLKQAKTIIKQNIVSNKVLQESQIKKVEKSIEAVLIK